MVSRAFVPAVLGLLVALLFLSSAAPTSAAVCGGAGIDLSSITFTDYYYNDTAHGYDWWFHPCGNVTVPQCQQLMGDPNGNVMLCQHNYGAASSYPVAIWTPESTQSITTWQAYGGGGGNNGGNRGVRMSLQDGASCGNLGFLRTLNVNFQCNNALNAGVATISLINETSTCVYQLNIQTRAACAAVNSTANSLGQVQCGPGGGGQNTLVLDTITTTDLVYKDVAKNYTYYFRPCGVVQSAQCANNPFGAVAGLAMMCQATGLNNELSPNTYDLAWWNPPLAVWNRAEVVTTTGTANAWTMEIADGTTCPANNGISRILKVFFVCDLTATTPIFYNLTETSTCVYAAYVRTVLACNANQISTQTSPCGGPYDLSFLTQKDLTYNRPGTNEYYVFRACGVVDNAVCQAQPNTNSSMMCQAYQGSAGTNDIAIYNPALVQYTPTLTGISMYIADGDVCGDLGPRSLTVNFVCSPGAPNQATFVGWSENPTCQYTATVLTSSVCHGQRSAYCGPIVGNGATQQNWDFSLGGTSEYAFTTADGSYTYYFQPCGQVLNAQCNNNNATQSSMLCQAVNGQLTTYDIAYYDSNLVSWYKLTNGWQMFVQDGTSCGGAGYERALTVNFICSTSGPATFVNLTETSTCSYLAFVNTPQACAPNSVGTQAGSTGLVLPVPTSTGNGLGYQAITRCGGIYNLLPLSTTDLTWTAGPQNEYNWVFRPCGAIASNPNCTKAAAAAGTAGGWMLCQDSKFGYGDYEGSSYNQYTVSWTTTRTGVLMQQADGAVCGALGPRVTRAFFVCNQSATTAVMTNVTEGPTCTYNLIIQTNLVCPSTATTCGGAGYDVSALTTRGDLQYNGTNGYFYFFNPCGTVQNSQCQSNVLTQSAMMCQASQTSTSTYNLGVWAPQAATWTALSNGVQMVVQDGSSCDGYDFERLLTVNFLCGTGFGYSMNVSEVKTCNYVANVQTGLACSQINTGNNNGGGGGGSSGLSGGAIAGIVIGSVVGALIILALLLVVCCGAMGGGLRKKSTNAESPKNSGRYGDMDNSTEASQSNVEMETASTHGEA